MAFGCNRKQAELQTLDLLAEVFDCSAIDLKFAHLTFG